MPDIREKGQLVARGLGLVMKAAWPYPVIWMALLVLTGLLPAAVVYLTKDVVDGLSAAIGGGASWENASEIILPGSLMVAAILLQQVSGSVIEYFNTVQQELVTDYIKERIHHKSSRVGFSLFEQPEFFDKLEQANSRASSQPLALLRNSGALIRGTVSFVSIAAILVVYSFWLIPILFLGMLPTLYVLIRYNEKLHAWWRRTTEERRWSQYFDLLLTAQPSAAEIRIFNLGDYFAELYLTIRKRLRGEKLDLMRRQVIANFIAALLAFLVTSAIIGWMVVRAMAGGATLGDLARFYQALNQTQSVVKSMLNSAGQIFNNTLFLQHLFDFLEVKDQDQDATGAFDFPDEIKHGIEFRDVTFRYPGNDDYVLEKFNLFIPAGKTVAFVGANGAGKSTIIKLMCRFYEPEAGQILIDGIDVRRISLKGLWDQLGLMMQYPVRYQATVRENIHLKNKKYPVHQDDLDQSAAQAGVSDFVSRLPKKYDSLLGRMFENSTELSGGQWQRLALARAYLRTASILVLDEPTSSMDSWSEQTWYGRFREVAEGKTAILITHRFTTAKQADVIHVMEGGEVIESGSHEELVALKGHYASSWNEQIADRSDTVSVNSAE